MSAEFPVDGRTKVQIASQPNIAGEAEGAGNGCRQRGSFDDGNSRGDKGRKFGIQPFKMIGRIYADDRRVPSMRRQILCQVPRPMHSRDSGWWKMRRDD